MRRSQCGQPPRCCRGGVPVSRGDEPEHRIKPIPRGSSRREFLTRSMLLAAGVPSLGAFLDACATSSGGSTGTGGKSFLKLASPSNPVTWPIANDNRPIASGLVPEKNATLRLYNYDHSPAPQTIKKFEKYFNCNVPLSTFNHPEEATTKTRRGGVPF